MIHKILNIHFKERSDLKKLQFTLDPEPEKIQL